MTELVSDILLQCNGATATPAGQSIQRVDINVFISPIYVASRLLEGEWSEALLIIDEPDPAHQRVCGDPGTIEVAPGVCDIKGTGTGQGVYDGSAERPNVFQGRIPPETIVHNRIVWPGVPIDGGQHRIRITNIRVNGIPPNGLGLPSQIFALVYAPSPLTISNATQVVAFSENSVTTQVVAPTTFQSCVGQNTGLATGAATSGTPQLTVRFTEQMPTAFRKRTAAPFVDADTSPDPVAQNEWRPITETGFYNPAFPSLPGRGNLARAGLADFGTRFYAHFSNIPSGVRLFAPTSVASGGAVARMIMRYWADGSFAPVSGNAAGLAEITTGSAGEAVVYEVLEANSASQDQFEVPIQVAYEAGVPAGAVQVVLGLGPLSTEDLSDSLSPVPRFKQVWNPVPAFTVEACAACAENVSGRVVVTRSGLRVNRTTNRFMQTITIQNTSGATIAGPLVLALDSLSANATLYSPAGTTECATPVSPYVSINAGADNALSPGESVIVGLEFLNPTIKGITYTTRVLAGSQR